MSRYSLILLCLAALLALAGCGAEGGLATSDAVQLSPTPPGAPGLAASLPGLPEDLPLNPLRMTAQATATLGGSTFERRSPNSTVNGNELQLPSTAGTVAWGLYHFGGAPGEEIETLHLGLSGYDAGEQVYVALGDYASGRWSFVPPVTTSTISIGLPGTGGPSPLQSPLGNTYVLVATFGGDDVGVATVKLTYPDRNSVTGHVYDAFGAGLMGVKVASSFGGVSATTALDGSYTLTGVPDGTWPVICTLDGYTFYSQPSYVTLAGADAIAPDITGDPHGARFTASDAVPNDNPRGAPPVNLESGPLDESVSADDDRRDCFRFTVGTPGSYLLHLRNAAKDMLLPMLTVCDTEFNTVASSAGIYSGEVAVALTVNSAPSDYVAIVSTYGGGGKYQLELEQTAYSRLGLEIQMGGVYTAGGGVITVANAASGISTDYLFNAYLPTVPGYALYDPAYPLGDTTATPQIDGYSFTPATQLITVAAGSLATQNFVPTPPAAMDSFEPNDFTGVAHAITVPYNSATGPDPLQLTGVNAGDTSDCFKCTPAVGTALALQLNSPGIRPGAQNFNVTIYDDAFNTIAQQITLNGAVICVPTALCNGNVVYIVINVDQQRNQVMDYSFRVLPVPNPVQFQAGARVNATDLLPSAHFQYFDSSFNRYVPLYADNSGLTLPIYLTAGETLNIDCYRYGTSHDRQTMAYNLPPSDSVLYFEAPDQGDDALEPNNYGTSPLVEQALPATISATLDNDTDPADNYKLAPGDGKPFKMTLVSSGGAQLFWAMYDSMGNYQMGGRAAEGETFYAPNDGLAGQYLELSPDTGSSFRCAYELDITTGDAYRITGTVKDTGAVAMDATLVLLETGDTVYSYNGGGGTYSFNHIYPPGSYTVAAFQANYDPANNTLPAVITNADVVVDFNNFTAMNHDAFEPNDDTATATPVVLATDYASSIGGGVDFGDYYKVMLATGDRIRVKTTPQDPWMYATIGLLDSYTDYGLYGLKQPDGTYVLNYTVLESGFYTFYVNGMAHYTFRIDKLN